MREGENWRKRMTSTVLEDAPNWVSKKKKGIRGLVGGVGEGALRLTTPEPRRAKPVNGWRYLLPCTAQDYVASTV